MGRRKKRLEQLLNLALAYKDWTRKELARTLGRDPTKLVPGTGIPKLDVVVELAAVLEWPVGDVVKYLWVDASGREPGDEATTAARRAATCHRDALRWRQSGRYLEVVDAATLGLSQPGVTGARRRPLQAILADAYYSLWSLVEARAIARDLVSAYEVRPLRTDRDRVTKAFAHFISGQTHRRLMSVEPQRCETLAAAARHELQTALALYQSMTERENDPRLEGLAATCAGAIVETDVALKRRCARDALDQLSAALERVRETAGLAPERLESFGWWCIFGCNIALRHLDDERRLQQHMAVFTNKADEIANQLDNWSMRERVFAMQYTRWERAAGSTCFEIPHVIDADDVRIITGTMGRFPSFRAIGWRILETAQIVTG